MVYSGLWLKNSEKEKRNWESEMTFDQELQ